MKRSSPLSKSTRPARTRLDRSVRLAFMLSAFAGLTAVSSTTALGANSPVVFNIGATDLSLGTNYNPTITPTAAPTIDVQFSGTYSSNILDVNGTALVFGTLNDLTTQALTISNNATNTAGSITLSTAANATAASTGVTALDLLFVRANGSLTFQNGAGSSTLTMNVVTTGNFDVAAGASLNLNGSVVVGSGSTAVALTLGGSGTKTIGAGATMTSTSGTAANSSIVLSAGTLNINGTVSNLVIGSNGNGGNIVEGANGVISGAGAVGGASPGVIITLGVNSTNVFTDNNTFTGAVSFAGGSKLTVSTIASTGAASGLGNASSLAIQTGSALIYNTAGTNSGTYTKTITFGNSGGSGTTGSILQSDSLSTLATLNFTGPVNNSQGSRNAAFNTVVLQGSNTGNNTFAPSSGLSNSTVAGGNIAAITKSGTGNWVLGGANSYGGQTVVNSGTLVLASARALGGGTSTLTSGDSGTSVIAGAALDLSAQTISEAVTIRGTGANGTGALINSSTTAAAVSGGMLSGVALTSGGTGYSAAPTVTLSGGGGTGAAATATLGITASSATVAAGGTGYTSAATVVVSGGGGAGATASLVISGGVITGITILSPGVGYTSTPTFTITANAGASGGSLTGNGTNFTVTGITETNFGTGYTSTPTVAFSSGNATAIAPLSGVILGADSSIGGTGPITVAGPVSGGFALAKVGTNVLTLSGLSTYTGATNVNGGTLLLANAAALTSATGPLTVNTGGTLLSNVTNTTLGGSVTVAGGTLRANGANVVGMLTLSGNQNFSMASGTLGLTLTSTSNYDQIMGTSTSTFSLTGGILDLEGVTAAIGNSYQVLNGFASTGNAVSGISFTGYSTGDGSVPRLDSTGLLTFVAVPEPGAMVQMGLLGCVGLLFVWNRRRQARA